MATYRTRDGDVVDDVAFRHYGVESSAVLRAVFEANPGLAGRGAILPRDVVIELPDLDVKADPVREVSLWD
jgi:phage tail protein X